MIKNELLNKDTPVKTKKNFKENFEPKKDFKSLLLKRAEESFQQKNYLLALGCYLSLLSFDPENARIWNKIAVTYFKIGEFKTAEHMSQIAYKLINKKFSE